MINLFFHHRAVQIVRAKTKRDLRDARRQHDPVRLDVIKIVQQQARYRDVAQIVVARRLWNVRQRRIVRVKRQRNERHESVRFILRLAQQHQMIHPLFDRFHVPVQHRRVRAQSNPMRLLRHAQPHPAAHLVVADNAPHTRMENLRTAARAGIYAGFLHFQ